MMFPLYLKATSHVTVFGLDKVYFWIGRFQTNDPDLGMHITDCLSNEGVFPRLSKLYYLHPANIFNKNI